MTPRAKGPRRRAALVALVVAVSAPVALLAACQDDPVPASQGPERRLADLPGVQVARVSPAGGADGGGPAVVVELDRDASAQEVADVLRAMGDLSPSSAALYVGPKGPTGSMVDGRSADAAARIADSADQVAAELVTAVRFSDAVVATVEPGSGDLTAVVDVTGKSPADAQETVREAFFAVASAPSERPPTISVTGQVDGGSVVTPVGTITAPGGGVDRANRTYTDAKWIGSDDRIVRTSVRVLPDGRKDLLLAVDVGDPSDVGAITRRARPDLWGLLRSRLAPVAAAPPGSTFEVRVAAPDGSGSDQSATLLSLTVDDGGRVTASRDPLGRGWGAAAVDWIAASS